METRRLITAVLVTMLAVMTFQFGLEFLRRKMGWTLPQQQAAPATQPTTAPAAVDPARPSTQSIAVAPAPAAALRAEPGTSSHAVELGSSTRGDPTFRLGVRLVPSGAAIERVVLNEFTKSVESKDPYEFQRPLAMQADWTRSLASRTITIDGVSVNLDSIAWVLESSDSRSAVYSVTLVNDAGPVARIRKSYEVFDKSDVGSGYEILVRQAVENLTSKPLAAQLHTNGPITPPREIDRGPDRYFVAGYQHQQIITVAHNAIEELTADKPSIDITRNEQNPLRWAGAVSVYFVAIARPLDQAADLIEKAEATAFNPAAEAHDRDGGVVFTTKPLTIEPGQSTTLPMRVFLGPRQRRLLMDDHFSQFGFNEILVLTGGPCAYCTFQWLIDVLVLLLRGFHAVFRDWGLAIIGLVVLVRLILHPVTKKSQVSMMRMSKLGPQIEALRKKHGDDKDALNREMMKFYKEQGATPILGCLPMFLQMPIWIALWSALNSTFELRHASFLWGFTWIKDLAKPDHLIAFSRPFDILFIHVSGLNLLPILMGVVFYLQMKFQPKPVSMTKEQEQQQKIMMWMMPLLFPLMLYSGPSGLNLYILTSTFIGIIESKRIRDHIKQREEAEAQQRVLIDARPTRGSKQAKKFEPDEAPKKGIAGWLANLQERAEQLRREAERKGKGRG
jgi:YidC/Oxa1 family membrane protein insertase